MNTEKFGFKKGFNWETRFNLKTKIAAIQYVKRKLGMTDNL